LAAYQEMVDVEQIHAYVVVAWSEDGREFAFWNTEMLGAASSLRADLAKKALDRKQNILDVQSALLDEGE